MLYNHINSMLSSIELKKFKIPCIYSHIHNILDIHLYHIIQLQGSLIFMLRNYQVYRSTHVITYVSKRRTVNCTEMSNRKS